MSAIYRFNHRLTRRFPRTRRWQGWKETRAQKVRVIFLTSPDVEIRPGVLPVEAKIVGTDLAVNISASPLEVDVAVVSVPSAAVDPVPVPILYRRILKRPVFQK